MLRTVPNFDTQQYPSSVVPQNLSEVDPTLLGDYRMQAVEGVARRLEVANHILSDDIVTLSDSLDKANHKIADDEIRIQQAYEASDHDYLTGVYSLRAYEQYVGEIIASHITSQRKGESGKQLEVVKGYIDLDHLGLWNDTVGEPMVNELVMRPLGSILRRTSRKNQDIIGRLGGDEFGVTLVAMPVEHMSDWLQTFLDRVAEIDLSGKPKTAPDRLTFSIGYTALRPTDTYKSLEKRANRAKKYAKEMGRDQAVDYADIPRGWSPHKATKIAKAS